MTKIKGSEVKFKEAHGIRAMFQPSTIDEDARTIEVVFATETPVARWTWDDGEVKEVLECASGAVRMERLDNGAPFLNSHSRYRINDVLGVVESAQVVNGEARATVRFSKRKDVEPVWQDVRDGILRNVSVGYKVHEYQITEKDGERKEYRAIDWEPLEISLVSVPADANSGVRGEEPRHREEEKPYDPDQDEDDVPLKATDVPKEATRTQKETPTRTQEEETREVPPEFKNQNANKMPENEGGTPTPVDETAVRAEASKQERTRITEINQITRSAGLPTDVAEGISTRAIDAGTSIEGVRKDVLDAVIKRQEDITSTRVTGQDETDKQRSGIEASMLIRAGVSNAVKLTEQERTLARAHMGKTLLDLAKDAVVRSGGSPMGDSMEIAKRAFTSSTSDFPVLLEGTARRVLQANYDAEPDTWRRFCDVGSVSDFREAKRLRMGSLTDLELVNELQEFKNKPITDADFEKVAVKTRGAIINVSRQMIVNDDLSGFTRLAQMLGRAAARSIENLVYEVLLSNAGLGPVLVDGSTLFHSANHTNIGTGSLLTVLGLDADRVLMRKQKDKDSNDFLDIRPSILLVPAELEGTATILNGSEYDPDAVTQGRRPNIVNGLFTDVVSSPRLVGTRRYLFANPAQHPVLEVTFLNGQQAPVMEQMPGFRVDGIEWKVRHDFGVSGVGYRGAVTNAGTT